MLTHVQWLQDGIERLKPLKADKGQQGGSCNVTACQEPGATWFNTSTRAFYCPSCARKINRACIDFREERLCLPPQ